MKSIALFFLISLIVSPLIIICSCDEPEINRPILELSGPVKKATLTVGSITCRLCTQRIRATLKSIRGVKTAEANTNAKDNVVLSFYSDHLDMGTIKTALENVGHGVTEVRIE